MSPDRAAQNSDNTRAESAKPSTSKLRGRLLLISYTYLPSLTVVSRQFPCKAKAVSEANDLGHGSNA